MSLPTPKQTFLNPTIPFAGTILGSLQPGEMVVIQGSLPSDADRFQIDFTCGSSMKPRADVAFHFNPRFKKSPCIVCNTFQREHWGREQILQQMPFRLGADFELIILVQTDMFKVALNGAHVLEYKHRLDLERVDTLAISGKVIVDVIALLPIPDVVSSEADPIKKDAQQTLNAVISSSGDLSLPYKGELANGLKSGRSIAISGRTSVCPYSFCFNLRVANSSDIAFHLNPRMKHGVLVRNSFLSGCWGNEETKLASFPFAPAKYFELIIMCDTQYFKVAVNGVHQLDYKHRVQDLSRISQLEISGDIELLGVKLL
ncbi:galectin-8-like isoform X2 [Genypterus blacodes]|uniref:galectin-8-like isoform X1 n=1 Tax=Genypterus blacodes TaxID=154954 RepID=UPI003F7718BC